MVLFCSLLFLSASSCLRRLRLHSSIGLVWSIHHTGHSAATAAPASVRQASSIPKTICPPHSTARHDDHLALYCGGATPDCRTYHVHVTMRAHRASDSMRRLVFCICKSSNPDTLCARCDLVAAHEHTSE